MGARRPILAALAIAIATSVRPDSRAGALGGDAPSALAVTSDAHAGDAAAPAGVPDAGALESGVADLRRWSFPLDRTRLAIVDLAPAESLGHARAHAGGVLAVNAGFFDERRAPLGLAVSAGRALSPFARALGGGVLTIARGVGTLSASEDFHVAPPAEDDLFAIQCRPRLVVDAQVNIKRDDGKRAARTALCLRDAGRTLDVVVTKDTFGPSLYALAGALARLGCEQALNLDGGPSTGAAWVDDEGIHDAAPRGPIRQAIVFARADAPG